MTGDQQTDHISDGQRVSRPVCRTDRHSLPTLLYFLFYSQVVVFLKVFVNAKSISPPHIIFNSNKQSDSRALLKERLNKRLIYGSRTNGTFASRTTCPDPSGNLSTTQACRRAVFCQRTNRNDDIHELINFDNR